MYINDRLRSCFRNIVQNFFWVRICYIHEINGPNDYRIVTPKIKCNFVPITKDNCNRVADFRKNNRTLQYHEKLTNNEIGWFAECEGNMVGSIWTTVNRSKKIADFRKFIKLKPNEALIHDVVVGKKSRGCSVGPFMVSQITKNIFTELKSDKIIVDVSIRNKASIRMMEKSGLRVTKMVLYISLLNKKILGLTLKKYNR